MDQRKIRFWQEKFRQWKESGLNQVEFCRREGLAKSTFQLWRRRLKEQSGCQSPVIVPVPVEKQPQPERPLRLHLRNGCFIEINSGFCQQTLQELLMVVGQ